jgi:hypothetical protein
VGIHDFSAKHKPDINSFHPHLWFDFLSDFAVFFGGIIVVLANLLFYLIHWLQGQQSVCLGTGHYTAAVTRREVATWFRLDRA